MKNMTLEFKVGLFTLFGLMSTGYLFYALKPDAFESKSYKKYYTYIENASGIVANSHVKTNGVSVGKVRAVKLGADNTKIVIEVESNVNVPKGSSIQIRSVGFLGDSHIEIIRSSGQDGVIEEGGFIPQSSSTSDLSGLIEVAGGVAEDIKKITENLSAALGNERGQRRIENMVDDLEMLLEHARGILEENRKNVKSMVSNFEQVSNNLREVLSDENREKLDRIIANFDDSMDEVRGATKNINLISERIEKGEGTIGRLVNDDKTLTELEGAIKDIREVLAPATKLQIAIDTNIQARSDSTSQTYFNLVFKTRPDRYYLVGFTDTVETITEERTKDNTSAECADEDNNCTTSREIREQKKAALRINLQFAKRWGWAALRFGLFETTGGFASDFYLLDDRIRFSIEAFDWQTAENDVRRVAHMKAYVSILFFQHIYLMAGIDDPTKYENKGDPSKTRKNNLFFGAGLTFNDEDIKALFGAAALSTAL